MSRQVAIRDAAGAVTRWIGTCTDVHDQKTAAEVLARDAQILAHVRDSVVVTDPDGVVTYWNEGATRLFGWTAAEMLGRPYADRFPEADRAAVRHEIRKRAAGVEWHGEYEDCRKDGKRVWLHARVGPIADAAGRPVGVLGLAYDLTDRKRAEEALAAVTRSVGDAIVTADERGTIGSVNPATERLFGYAAAELVGRSVRVLMPEPHGRRAGGYLAEYLRTGTARIIGTGREVEGRRKDGTKFPADLSVTECRIEGARCFTGVIRDITERKRLEAQFMQAQKMEAVGRLAGGVAHDFNNLLTVINGYCDMLLPATPPGHPAWGPLTAVRDAGERAAALTSQLLSFSRKAIVAPRMLDLNDVIAQSEKLLRRLIGEDVLLAAALAPTPCRINADPTQLDQVIMNLAVNARDAMPTGGRLTLATRRVRVADGDLPRAAEVRPGWFVELTVRDTGCGMPDDVKAKLFEPFFTTKGPGRGTGLGLAVVHGVVKQAGGHVSVESAVGAGTAFRILFPEAAAPPQALSGAHVLPVPRGTETVLLVEDEEAVRTLCRIALESQGYAVLAAGSGSEALAALDRHAGPIHLLVADVVMPNMSGRELADAARARLPGLRVMYVSGYTDDAVVRHGVREATDAFLQKPFTPLGLVRKVRAVLDGAG
jgi:PAS domain S-box-containing protein